MTFDKAMIHTLEKKIDELEIEVGRLRETIKTLEQEPCKDCISREDAIKQCGFGMTSLLIAGCLRRLPSVTPQPKIGKWINKYAEDGCGERYSYWACSECGRGEGFNLANIEDVLSEYPYCHCGAKMIEPQKRGE